MCIIYTENKKNELEKATFIKQSYLFKLIKLYFSDEKKKNI